VVCFGAVLGKWKRLAKQHAAVKSPEIKMKLVCKFRFVSPNSFGALEKGNWCHPWTLQNYLFVKNFLWKTDWMSRL